jgi:hypothetical protein
MEKERENVRQGIRDKVIINFFLYLFLRIIKLHLFQQKQSITSKNLKKMFFKCLK